MRFFRIAMLVALAIVVPGGFLMLAAAAAAQFDWVRLPWKSPTRAASAASQQASGLQERIPTGEADCLGQA